MKVVQVYLLACSTTVILLVTLQLKLLSIKNQFKRTYVGQTEQIGNGNCNRLLQQEITWLPSYTNPPRSRSNRSSTAEEKPAICKDIRDKYLQGWINLSETVSAEDVRNDAVLSWVRPGGMYEPRDCVDEGGTAIIIPFRNREKHLETLIYHLHNILQRQRLRYGIFVVEMAMPTQFNRGLLANAGFLTANSLNDYNCFIIHDVDLLPNNDRNLYTCGDKPRHLAANSTKHAQGLPYEYYLGGVMAMTGDQYRAVNGFSNMFFGWGGEDDDMYIRIKLSNMTLVRAKPKIGSYVALLHKRDVMNPPNPHRRSLLDLSHKRKSIDGLNSLMHQRKALEFRQYYTWLLTECVESSYFTGFPYLRAQYARFEAQKMAEANALKPAEYKIIYHKVSKFVSNNSLKTQKKTQKTKAMTEQEVTRHPAQYKIVKHKGSKSASKNNANIFN